LKENPLARSLDIKRLHVPLYGYRLRLGDYRMLFDVIGDTVWIFTIKHRKDAYKKK